MTFINPMTIAFWFAVVPGLVGVVSERPGAHLPIMCVGVFLGTIGWVVAFVSLLNLAGKYRKRRWLVLADELGGMLLLMFAALCAFAFGAATFIILRGFDRREWSWNVETVACLGAVSGHRRISRMSRRRAVPFDPAPMQRVEKDAAVMGEKPMMTPLPTTLQSPFPDRLPAGQKEKAPPTTGMALDSGPIVRMPLREVVQRTVANNMDVRVASYQPAIDRDARDRSRCPLRSDLLQQLPIRTPQQLVRRKQQ